MNATLSLKRWWPFSQHRKLCPRYNNGPGAEDTQRPVARAILQGGSGSFTVNGKLAGEYFKNVPAKARHFLWRFQDLPPARDVLSRLDGQIEVWGSSPTTIRQAKAVAHALARAMTMYEPKLKSLLKDAGFGGVRMLSKLSKGGEE
ncbi:30S ribosomal protein S9 [Acetomicrobium sp.]|uniref:30S ribosomal protein S9 n=1 Tax=Acetomicrobium sp. TaxID=1872099 RepID=UPI002FC9C290